jgi:hypothetical protein
VKEFGSEEEVVVGCDDLQVISISGISNEKNGLYEDGESGGVVAVGGRSGGVAVG